MTCQNIFKYSITFYYLVCNGESVPWRPYQQQAKQPAIDARATILEIIIVGSQKPWLYRIRTCFNTLLLRVGDKPSGLVGWTVDEWENIYT